MKSEVISVSSKGRGIDAAMAETDRMAETMKLSRRDALHMRLLAEEMMSMMRSIIGDLEGRFWIEAEGNAYRLILQTKTLLDAEQRSQLLSASTSGKNEAHRGIMGKLRAFLEPMPVLDTPAFLIETAEIPGNENGELTWSLEAYRERLRKRKDTSEGALEEWDELEKSVVSHIADNVEISIRVNDVDIVISKKLA